MKLQGKHCSLGIKLLSYGFDGENKLKYCVFKEQLKNTFSWLLQLCLVHHAHVEYVFQNEEAFLPEEHGQYLKHAALNKFGQYQMSLWQPKKISREGLMQPKSEAASQQAA